ncbi:MAG: heme b synthase [Deltaproteobacteria bacterium]|nr:heme b synthase [Deltaproteobacteria bacterium]
MKSRQLPILPHTLRMVAWEVTRSCNLACIHCRASSVHGPYEGELSTDQGFKLLDEIAAFSKPVIILTGGEPLLRKDIFKIASYGDKKGLRMVLATNGTLVTEEIAGKMIDAGIKRVSISIDGEDAQSHDAFRKVAGAFDGALAGIEAMKTAGMEFQINTTITKANLDQIQGIMDLAIGLGAAAHHIFLLVPTGRGKEMSEQAISPEDYEKTLNWFYEEGLHCPIQLKATCAPHYYRIFHQKSKGSGKEGAGSPLHTMTRGCLGGSSFCFISHTGQVQPCGYLEVDCGRIKEKGFEDIWNNSPIFQNLRDLNQYKGKCGRCEFIKVCGGCRARAYEITGDYLAEEPFCIYEPKT